MASQAMTDEILAWLREQFPAHEVPDSSLLHLVNGVHVPPFISKTPPAHIKSSSSIFESLPFYSTIFQFVSLTSNFCTWYVVNLVCLCDERSTLQSKS